YVLFAFFFFFQAEDGIRDGHVTGVQTCALPIWPRQEGRRPDRGQEPLRRGRAARATETAGRSSPPGRPTGSPLAGGPSPRPGSEIGRAACRERGERAGVSGALKTIHGRKCMRKR